MAEPPRSSAPTQPDVEPSRRLRFARREVEKALKALEMADGEQVDFAMRVLELEDRLSHERELTSRWRRSYEGLSQIIAMNPDDRLRRLDELAREWVGKA